MEEANGIDELGFLDRDAMVNELYTWRAMLGPIRATTGINTKLLVALEMGLPLIVTSAAAAPFAHDPIIQLNLMMAAPRAHAHRHVSSQHAANSSSPAGPAGPLMLADEPAAFISHATRIVSSDAAWRASSRAALEAYQRLEAADPALEDMRLLLNRVHDRHAQKVIQSGRSGGDARAAVDTSIFNELPAAVSLRLPPPAPPPAVLSGITMFGDSSLCAVVDTAAAACT